MTNDVYWISVPWKGRLGILPRPRGGDWLEDEIESWHLNGIEIVVSMLTQPEVDEFDLQGEARSCNAHGIEFNSFPIRDLAVPSSAAETVSLVKRLVRALSLGKNIGLHCRQGIGRSSIIAATILVASGENAARAFRLIEAARGRPVPDTPEQKEWVGAVAREWLADASVLTP